MASSRSSATTLPRSAPARRLGSETPRIYTPPLRPLTARTSLGFSAIEFATDVLGIELFPWQKWLLIHALELRAEGGFRFRNVVVLVARQNGKSTLSQVLALWFMYVYGYDLVLGTAQDLDTAEEVWQGAVDLVTETDLDDEPLRPELFDLYQRTVMVNGKKSLELKTGARYKAKAASRRSGRGLSGDLVLLDELREHQTWDAWGAITKTTMARDEAMIWALSNAGDGLSVVLGYLRKLAHLSLGDPDGLLDPDEDLHAGVPDDVEEADDLGIFEWSAAPGCDIWDRDGWAQANPSLGHKISERTISSAARTDPEGIFRTEVLCQWVKRMDTQVIDPAVWQALLDPDSTAATLAGFGFDVTPSSTAASIHAAGLREDGLIHLELVDDEQGTDWCLERLTGLWEKWSVPIVLDPSGPAGDFVDKLEAAGVQVIALKSREYAAACQAFVTEVNALRVRHQGWPAMTTAISAAKKRDIGDGGWGWARKKSTANISPLVSATAALHGLTALQNAAPNVW